MTKEMKGPLRILLVEDNQIDTRFIQLLMRPFGEDVELRCVSSVDEAWVYLRYGDGSPRAHKPHLVIIDYFMGMHSGCDFLRDFKEKETFRLIPVVVVSVSDDPRLIEEAYDLGACGWFLKDRDLGQRLKTLVAYWLGASLLPESRG